ncbi:Uracil-DNA glycosylase 2 [Dictyocoela muelleri]|nr:Uracil-DNA glycosylase 2 [Dictyocoela muelleri]
MPKKSTNQKIEIKNFIQDKNVNFNNNLSKNDINVDLYSIKITNSGSKNDKNNDQKKSLKFNKLQMIDNYSSSINNKENDENNKDKNKYSDMNICEKHCKICNLKQFMSENWLLHLNHLFDTDDYNLIIQELHKNKFYPVPENVFRFSKYFDLEDTKVVIIGQDPYHNEGQAMGLAFSVDKNVKIPPSLINIYKEVYKCQVRQKLDFRTKQNVYNCIDQWINNVKKEDKIITYNGSLIRWAQQGVLLLNGSLTVQKHKPGSHMKMWEKFTDEIIKKINEKCKNTVFLLWGNYAKKKSQFIDKNKHKVLEAGHPSPFSVKKFLGCNHFELTNEYLKIHGKDEILW